MQHGIKHRNGTWRYIECTTTNFLNDPAIGGLVEDFSDITDQVIMDHELRKSHDLFQNVIDDSPLTSYLPPILKAG
jgi:hypothetical protein